MTTKVSDIAKNSDRVDYEKAKLAFFKLVDHWLGSQKYKELYDVHYKAQNTKIIEEICRRKRRSAYPQYEVVNRDGKNVLILKRKSIDDYVRVLDWEQMFDIFMPLHVKSGHKGRQQLMKLVGKTYEYPTMCLTFFKRICNVCIKNDGKHSEEPTNSSGLALVYIINMVQVRVDEKFRYLLIYAFKDTNFVILRPLMAKTEIEISTELFKIFTQFGPPIKLHIHGYNINLTQKIESTLEKFYPEFKTVPIVHKPASYDLPSIVTDKIQDWMNTTKSDVWEVGCCIVQRQMNSDPKVNHKHISITPNSEVLKTSISPVTDGKEANKAVMDYEKQVPIISQTSSEDNFPRTVADIVEAQIKNSYTSLANNVGELLNEMEKPRKNTTTSKIRNKIEASTSTNYIDIIDESLDSLQSFKNESVVTDNDVITVEETVKLEVEYDFNNENEGDQSMETEEDPLSLPQAIPDGTITLEAENQETDVSDDDDEITSTDSETENSDDSTVWK